MRFTLLTALGFLFLAASCANETLDQTTSLPDRYDAEHYVQLAEEMLAEDSAPIEFRKKPVTVAPGANQLQSAIDQAGPGGTVLLEAGMHTESDLVVITQRVKITGEPGAVVVFDTDETLGNLPFVADGGFHILNANQVVVENLTIRDADESGGTAIVIEGSQQTRIRNNVIEYFELGIAQYESNSTRVHDNSITGKTSFFGVGILSVSGENMKIYDNIITNNNLNVFVGDKGGLMKDNLFTTSDGAAIGVLLCTPNVRDGVYLALPSGQVVAAEVSANRWLLLHNYAENHVWNYLVLDNANNNTLVNNDAANALLVDIEMAGETDRIGVVTPTTFDNLTISSAYPDVTIKVCGVGNEAVGGDQVDTNAFPCE
jgi:hypothetical protein